MKTISDWDDFEEAIANVFRTFMAHSERLMKACGSLNPEQQASFDARAEANISYRAAVEDVVLLARQTLEGRSRDIRNAIDTATSIERCLQFFEENGRFLEYDKETAFWHICEPLEQFQSRSIGCGETPIDAIRAAWIALNSPKSPLNEVAALGIDVEKFQEAKP